MWKKRGYFQNFWIAESAVHVTCASKMSKKARALINSRAYRVEYSLILLSIHHFIANLLVGRPKVPRSAEKIRRYDS